MFLRRIARPLMAKVKETTGIVGLDVVPNAREVLISLYTKTLNEIQTVPEDEGYRKAVESFTSHRLKVCQEEEDWEQIEKRLGCGQVEELIEEAQDELKLLSMLNGEYNYVRCLIFYFVLVCIVGIVCLFGCWEIGGNEEKGVLTVVLMMRNDTCVRLGFGGSFMFCGK